MLRLASKRGEEFLCWRGTGYVFELFKTSVLLSLEMFCLSCTLLDEVVNAEPLFIGLCRQGHTGYVSVLVAETALKVLVVFMPAACLFFIINIHFEYSKREWCYYKLIEHGILLDFDGYEGGFFKTMTDVKALLVFFVLITLCLIYMVTLKFFLKRSRRSATIQIR